MRLLLCILLISCLFAEPVLRRTRVLMGTYATLTLPADHNLLASETFERIAAIEHALSTFDKNASLYRLNHTHGPLDDPVLSKALAMAVDYYRQTDGYFDVTIGSITKSLYHFGEAHPASPSPSALQHAKRNIEGIHIDGTTVQSDKDIVIDLGGMGKGYAVDKAAGFLREHNITRAIVALSGDIRCIGKCTIGIQSPFKERIFAKARSKIANLSISTSGTYRRYATRKSEHHLINPKSAMQAKAFVSVTLFTDANNTTIDAYATAVSVMPKATALAFLKRHPKIGYILVEPNGKVIDGNWNKLVDIAWYLEKPIKR
ncbi:Thiamin biosynthesis lipoprotein ApbE [hydrothermal vent metagenome]|uniref:FAD:protein FMN transferase n=1 Tax=hydrothermal vent metagenome TaxID=652676 RepID=A0A1W1EA11_9ZZZZ